jgi:hypothetical protein
MKYTIYEDPVSHRFAFVALPSQFADGDALPGVVANRWFATREEAIAALPELLNVEEATPDVGLAGAAQRDRGRDYH